MNDKKGTLLECSRHWIASVGADAASILTAFTGVQQETAHKWVDGNQFPKGFIAIRLTTLLDLAGYAVTDQQPKMHPDIAIVRRALGLGLIKPEYLAGMLQMPIDSVNKILRGRVHTSAKRLSQLQRCAKEMRGKISEADGLWRARLNPNATPPSRGLAAPPAQSASSDKPAAGSTSVCSTKISQSLVTILNSMSNIAGVGIDPGDLTPEMKQDIAYTVAQLFKKLGIDAADIAEFQRRQEQSTTNMGNLSRVLLSFQGKGGKK